MAASWIYGIGKTRPAPWYLRNGDRDYLRYLPGHHIGRGTWGRDDISWGVYICMSTVTIVVYHRRIRGASVIGSYSM